MSDDTKEHETLVRNAAQFLEAGGSITYGEWLDIPIDHRVAILEARDIINSETLEAIEARADSMNYDQLVEAEQQSCQHIVRGIVEA